MQRMPSSPIVPESGLDVAFVIANIGQSEIYEETRIARIKWVGERGLLIQFAGGIITLFAGQDGDELSQESVAANKRWQN